MYVKKKTDYIKAHNIITLLFDWSRASFKVIAYYLEQTILQNNFKPLTSL